MSASGPAGASRAQRLAFLAALLAVFWLALQLFAAVLLPFVAAAVIAYFLDPLARRMTHAGIGRPYAAGLLVVGLILLGTLALLLLYPLVMAQLGLLIGRLPDYVLSLQKVANDAINRLQAQLGPGVVNARLHDLVSSEAGTLLSFVGSAASRLIGGSFALFNVLALLVVTPLVAFYLLRDWPGVVSSIDSWLPRRYTGIIREQALEVDRILSAWLRGQALSCLALAAFYATGLTVAGLDLGLIVGLATGVLSFMPYVGTITGFVTSVALALGQWGTWGGVVSILVVFGLGQVFENYLIYPRFLGDRVELHAVWVIFALFAGGAAFGFLGVLLAVPVSATIGVLCRFWLRRYLASPLYLDPPERAGGT
jgi:predicted PurR-regulated permease PerM